MRRQFLKDRDDDAEGKENQENQASSSIKKDEKPKRGIQYRNICASFKCLLFRSL